jgi:hypothetical protein
MPKKKYNQQKRLLKCLKKISTDEKNCNYSGIQIIKNDYFIY